MTDAEAAAEWWGVPVADLEARVARERGEPAPVRLAPTPTPRPARQRPPREPRPKRPEPDWDALPLGEVSDRELALSIRVRRSRVREARVARGIPPMRALPPGLPLGQMSDREIARRWDLARSTVTTARIRAGIPRWRPPEPTAPAATKPAAPAAPKPSTAAERVARAVRWGRGEALSAERVARAAGLPPYAVHAALREAADRGLVRSTAGGWVPG